MTKEDKLYLKNFDWNRQTLEPFEQSILLEMFNRVFNEKRFPTTCTPCWVEMLGRLKEEYFKK